MRLLFTTMILTMLVQSVWAEDQLDQNEIREIIATTTNEGVASALASCLTQETLTVDMTVRTDDRGNILSADVQDELRVSLDPYFKASAIAAKRALVECSPLPISPEQRENFEEFIFSFNPALLNKE